MNHDPKTSDNTLQSENETNQDLNLTNSDSTLVNPTSKQADAPLMTDNATSAGSDNLTQSIMNGGEINPEYGDAADPTFEIL